MDQTLLPQNNQSENKSAVNIPPDPPDSPAPLVASPAQPASPVLLVPDNASKPAINMNAQHSGRQFKLASVEVQGPKPPLVSGKGSKFALIAIASILIVIICIGGYYFYTKDNNPEPVNSSAAVIPTATPAADKNSDSDKDGLPDTIEKILGTYMTKADTDGDGFNDFQEIKNGYSPLIAGGEGKYTFEEWDNIKGKIKIEDRELYEKEFETPVPSPSSVGSLYPSSAPDSVSSVSPVFVKKCDYPENIGGYIKQGVKIFPWDEKVGMSGEFSSYGLTKEISSASQVIEIQIASVKDQNVLKATLSKEIKNDYKDCEIGGIKGSCYFLTENLDEKIKGGEKFVWSESLLVKIIAFSDSFEKDSIDIEGALRSKLAVFVSQFKNCTIK